MKTITLILASLILVSCQSEMLSSSTPTCDRAYDPGWGKGYGVEVESSTNLDADKCLPVDDVWCCAL